MVNHNIIAHVILSLKVKIYSIWEKYLTVITPNIYDLYSIKYAYIRLSVSAIGYTLLIIIYNSVPKKYT